MSQAVSYKQATQVALVGIAIAAFPPVTVAGGICSVATSILGFYGVEALDKIREGFTKGLDKARYSIMEIPSSVHSPKLEDSDIKKIDARFEQVVQRFQKEINTYDDDMISPERRKKLDSDKNELLNSLKYGCCYGAVSTLFDDIEKNSFSIEQSALRLNRDGAYFGQVIQAYGRRLTQWYEVEKQLKQQRKKELKDLQIQKCRVILQKTVPSSSSTSTIDKETAAIEDNDGESSDEELKEMVLKESVNEGRQILKILKKERANLKEIDPLYLPILESPAFAPDSTPQSYCYVFEKMIKSIPKNALVRGRIIISELHSIGFQFAPKEYYVYDTYMGALFKFSDQELCFAKVRSFVLRTLKAAQRVLPDTATQNPKVKFEITHWKA